MKVTVVVPTHGRREFSTRTLRSLAQQSTASSGPRFALETVVVDDGADPGLSDHVRSLSLDLDTRVLHHETNRGRSAARNSGIAVATGDIVIFLDGDMVVDPGFVEAHLRAHEDGDGESVVLGCIRTAREIERGAFVRYIDSRGVQKLRIGEPIPARYFMTGNSSVARTLLDAAGPFDEEFNEYGGEDTEMGYRLAQHGGTFRYAPGAVSWHLHLNTVPEMAERLRAYGERMLPVLVRKAPQARTELGLRWAEPIRWGHDRPSVIVRKVGATLLSREILWRPAAWIGQRIPTGFPAAGWLYDFVRASAYLDGYRVSLRQRERTP